MPGPKETTKGGAVEITGHYRGGLGVALEHGPSGTTLTTAAPVDNQGDGSSFSPTDLAAAALGSCMVTLMAIAGERRGLDLTGLRFEVAKHMNANPRRIGTLELRFDMPAGIGADDRKRLERAALTCPVHKSLHPDIEIPVDFVYPEAPAADPA